MTQDTYRFAYEEASAELREILAQFDQLRARKAKMEQIVEVLKPLLTDVPASAAITAAVQAPVPAAVIPAAVIPAAEPAPFLMQTVSEIQPEPVLEVTPEPAPEPAFATEVSSDPFQRRIDNALKHGFGSRESRILPRALNGLLSRA
jgi:hypothetical protein